MKRRIILIVLLIIAALAAAYFFFPSAKSLSHSLVSNDDTQRNMALMQLSSLSPEKKAQLVDELVAIGNSTEWQTRRYALYALRRLSAPPEKALPLVFKLLDDANQDVRKEAMITLTEMGSAATPELVRALPGTTGRTRDGIIKALAGMGPASIDQILPLLKSENPQGRILGAMIIGQMSPPPTQAKAALTPLLLDTDAEARMKAAIALNTIDPSLAATVPAHMETIARKTWDSDTAAAVKFLKGLGPKAKAAVTALNNLLKASDDDLTDKNVGRGAVAEALNKIDPRRNGMTGVLWDLKQSDPILRYRAAYALSEMTPPNPGALPDLLKAMDDKDVFVRARAVVAAVRIGFDKSERLKPALIKKASESLNVVKDERVKGYSPLVQGALNIAPPKTADEEETGDDAPAAHVP